jgi:hypothetical protein
MSLKLDAITKIARKVVEAESSDLAVAGVTSRDGDADRVEVLIDISGCHREPCRLMLNLNRSDPAALEHDLRSELAKALSDHVSDV